MASDQQVLEVGTPEALGSADQDVGSLLGDHPSHEHDAQPRIAGGGCRDLAIRCGGEPLAIDAVGHDSNPFGQSPGEGGTRALGQRVADADDRRNAVEHATRLAPRVRAQEVVVRVQHDPMPRVAQQPGQHRGVVREHECRLARTDRFGDGLVVPRNGGARESDPSAGEVDHAFPSRRAPRAGVLDDRRAVVSRPHGRAVEHDEVPKGRALTACRSREPVDDRRDRRAGAGREVIAGRDGVENVGQEFLVLFRPSTNGSYWPVSDAAEGTARRPRNSAPSPGCRNDGESADRTVCRLSPLTRTTQRGMRGRPSLQQRTWCTRHHRQSEEWRPPPRSLHRGSRRQCR